MPDVPYPAEKVQLPPLSTNEADSDAGMPMPGNRRRDAHMVLGLGWGGFCLYLALAAIVFRMATEPFVPHRSLAATGYNVETYIVLFDMYFLFAAVFGISLRIYYKKIRVDRVGLFLMVGPALIVLATLQIVYAAPFIRGILAVSPIIGLVYLIGKVGESARTATRSKSLWDISWFPHLIGATLLMVIFEIMAGTTSLLGGLLIWGGALFLAVLLLGKAISSYEILRPIERERTMANGAAKTGLSRELRLFKVACAITFIVLVLPLNTLVMDPHPEIEDAYAETSGDGEVRVHLVVVNRYARPLEGTIEVYATVEHRTYLVDERNGLEGLGAWTIASSDIVAGSSGSTCHFSVVYRGQKSDEEDAVIQSECVVFPVMIMACVLCTGVRKMAARR